MKRTYRYGGAAAGAITSWLINRFLFGNKSTSSGVISALLGGGLGLAAGEGIYRYRLGKADKKLGKASTANADKIIEAAKQSFGDRDRMSPEFVAHIKNVSKQQFGIDLPDEVAQDFQYAVLMSDVADEFRAGNDRYTTAPLGVLGKDPVEHADREQQLDEWRTLMYGDPDDRSAPAKWGSKYRGTGLTQSEFEQIEFSPEVHNQYRGNRLAAAMNYSRLSKEVYGNSILRSRNGGANLHPLEVDYIAYNAMPETLRKSLPVSHRMVAIQRAAESRGWAYAVDYDLWHDPNYLKHVSAIVDNRSRLYNGGYLAASALTGGSGKIMLPMLVGGIKDSIYSRKLPVYDPSMDFASNDGWTARHARTTAMEHLMDPQQSPLYEPFISNRMSNIKANNVLNMAAALTDLSLDTRALLTKRIGPLSFGTQTAFNAMSGYPAVMSTVYSSPEHMATTDANSSWGNDMIAAEILHRQRQGGY